MFQRHFDDGLAQASFLIACDRTREAVVIDPRRDVGVYLEAAARHDVRIVYSIETHIHADFVSGSRELSAKGVRTVAGPGSALQFAFHETRDGETLRVGDLALRFLHTPGHTPEHVSILVESVGRPFTGRQQSGTPVRLFTGDTLFVGAVGRPDLLGEELTRQLAGELYDSLFGKILQLADDVEVHPGHGAGSLCGAGIGNEPHSTIGRERQFNPMLRHASRDTFVAAVLADLPETPPYFPRMKKVNHAGPPILGLADRYPPLRQLTPLDASKLAEDGAWIVDLRSPQDFAAAHPRGAVHLGFGSKVGYWAGWILPAGARVVLISPSETHIREAQAQMLRVGIDRIEGYVAGGFDAWRDAGLPVQSVGLIDVRELQAQLDRRAPLTIMDVRTRKEFAAGHVDGAINVPVGDLREADAIAAGLKPRPTGDRGAGRIATICEGGYRSSLAASLLQRHGVADVVNVTGGMSAFRALQAS